MLIEAIICANIITKVNKSLEMDEKATKRYSEAFTKENEASELVYQKKTYADKKLTNLAKKKRAVITTSIPMFVEVYDKIQKVNIESDNKALELMKYSIRDKNKRLDSLSMITKKEFSDKELVVGMITKGLFGIMVEDSKRNLSAANSQLSAANALYSQASTIGTVYDAIADRSERISKLIVNMNMLFIGSINETKHVIEKNGIDVKKYSKKEKETLMMCVNMAVAISDLLKIPVMDENGELADSAIDMIEVGENYITKINEEIKA